MALVKDVSRGGSAVTESIDFRAQLSRRLHPVHLTSESIEEARQAAVDLRARIEASDDGEYVLASMPFLLMAEKQIERWIDDQANV